MGKRKTSKCNSSTNSSSSTQTQKSRNKTLKNKRIKLQKSINKLYNNLRRESLSNKSIIIINDTITPKKSFDNTVVENSVIEIHDDEPNLPNTQTSILSPKRSKILTHCSTPLANHSTHRSSHDSLNVSNIQGNNSIDLATNFNKEVADITKEINQNEYLTIDLTADTTLQKTEDSMALTTNNNTVIDLDKDEGECSSLASNSLSDDSNVTVLNRKQYNDLKKKRMQTCMEKLSNLNAADKGKLFDMIYERVFNGCTMTNHISSQPSLRDRAQHSRATETIEDKYIKEVILNEAASRNSIGSNIYNPEKDANNKVGKRMIVIDGSNVAMEHSRGRIFSVKGLKICIDYWLRRGHVVKSFVPRFRCKFGKSSDPRLLDELERQGYVIYTPSREIQGRTITSYDDRYIVQCAAEFDAVIVSGDQYRDLALENPRWRRVIETRLLPFTWVDDMIMFPRDPLGRNGPTLEEFVTHS